MPADNFIGALLQQATAQASRSTALKPLGWLIAMLLPATIGSFVYKAPGWLGVALAVLTTVSVAFYLGSYLFLLFKDRDTLRSERYTLQKLAIEKGLYGDSLVGILEKIDKRALIVSKTSQSQRADK